MGIQIDVRELTGYNTRADYSGLLQSLPSRSGNNAAANLGFLADYASLKNGSYRKLMNAYYGDGGKNVDKLVNNSSLSTSKDTGKQLKEIQTSADALKTSADKLLTTGAKSLFNGKEVTTTDEAGVTTKKTEYDTDAIYKAVSAFVADYNSLIEKGGEANTANISGKVDSLIGMTKANKDLLEKVGITIGENGKLSVNEDDFKKADMASVKSLFNGTGSYAYRVSAQASLIDFAAANEAAKSNTYNANGSFTNNYNTGNIFGSYF